MTVQRAVTAFAGTVVLSSVLLSRFVHPGFIWVAAFVGANLLQSSFTGFCPLAILLRKAGLPDLERGLPAPNATAGARLSA